MREFVLWSASGLCSGKLLREFKNKCVDQAEILGVLFAGNIRGNYAAECVTAEESIHS
jgi:hypothetical protein